MSKTERKYQTGSSGVLSFLQVEIEKVKRSLPKSYDSIAEFLAISRPIVEVTLMNCGDWADQVERAGPGKPSFPHTSMMLIHVLCKMRNVSYRQIEREINEHPSWLKALRLIEAPSHSTLSTFRAKKGEHFFKDFFNKLTDLLYHYNLTDSKEIIVDSAPIIASMNFARANATPKINIEHVREFFSTVDVSPVIQYLRTSNKRKYSLESMIRYLMFEKLGGFLSTSQALKFLEKNATVAEILGFKGGQLPTQPTISYFLKSQGPAPYLLRPMVDAVTDFFEGCEATPEDTDIDFFFWSF
jgi:hypothetical protein